MGQDGCEAYLRVKRKDTSIETLRKRAKKEICKIIKQKITLAEDGRIQEIPRIYFGTHLAFVISFMIQENGQSEEKQVSHIK
jgi:hypothetical protein